MHEELGNCHWTQDDDWDNSSTYHTDCGEAFDIINETPDSNGMKFCCYCGRHLIQILFDRERAVTMSKKNK